MKLIHIRLLAGLCLGAFVAAGCSATGDTPTSETPTASVSTPAGSATVQPPAEPATTSAQSAPVGDPFEQYWAALTKADPATYTDANKAQQRDKFNNMVKVLCPQGRDAMLSLKQTSTDINVKSKGPEGAKVSAVAVGALWEFGCGKGHDDELYAPLPVKDSAQGKAPWPCEPGYPNCTKADSERYQSQLEHKKSTEVRDANGETKEEYCKRTGQPLATCQAG
jgi:hypothetical protein